MGTPFVTPRVGCDEQLLTFIHPSSLMYCNCSLIALLMATKLSETLVLTRVLVITIFTLASTNIKPSLDLSYVFEASTTSISTWALLEMEFRKHINPLRVSSYTFSS
ncbi:hypothetical protein Nepgr_004982 [Nepenthes gracilis]|uniref:Uncharacterized protein n=1 Tax=Nepenthes gracilis TaxID=150966 RepID=A0AAD3S2A4_NEPGR|nr:hypothetical protein Nepgr_004982 [Nepenthes gracilis]